MKGDVRRKGGGHVYEENITGMNRKKQDNVTDEENKSKSTSLEVIVGEERIDRRVK